MSDYWHLMGYKKNDNWYIIDDNNNKICDMLGDSVSQGDNGALIVNLHNQYVDWTQDATIAMLESQLAAANEWIPVSERLPDKDTTEQWEMYECKLNRYGEIKIAPLWFIGGDWVPHCTSRAKYNDFVTEWRPLPEPPHELQEAQPSAPDAKGGEL
jgi:hypothetical protein